MRYSVSFGGKDDMAMPPLPSLVKNGVGGAAGAGPGGGGVRCLMM